DGNIHAGLAGAKAIFIEHQRTGSGVVAEVCAGGDIQIGTAQRPREVGFGQIDDDFVFAVHKIRDLVRSGAGEQVVVSSGTVADVFEHERVIAHTTGEHIGTHTARQRIVARSADQDIGALATNECVVQFVPGEVHCAGGL